MEVLGYISAVMIGMVLGLFGAGGAIISFPALVYFMKIPPIQASIYSLIIVGIASAVGVYKHFAEKNIDVKVSLIFSVPLLIAFYLFKFLIIPAIPQNILSISSFMITKNHLIMILFFIVLSVVIYKMLFQNKETLNQNNNGSTALSLSYIIHAVFVGILAASIGAGGGFIIVPALINTFNMPVKKATGTSLAIITINSLIGSIMNAHDISGEYALMTLFFATLAVIGIIFGTYLNKIISNAALKKYYAYFLVLILFSSIITEIYKNYQQIHQLKN